MLETLIKTLAIVGVSIVTTIGFWSLIYHEEIMQKLKEKKYGRI